MTISLLRTVILYILVIISMRVMGKRQIGEMQASELVVTLMISDLATLPMQDTGVSIFYGLVPILGLVFMELIISFIMLKSRKLRRVIGGSPVIVIRDGVIIQQSMKDLRYSNDDLQEDLRKNNIFDISTVDYAIVETDGTISFSLKPEYAPLTPDTAGKPPESKGIASVLMSDGKIIDEALELSNKDRNWVQRVLQKEELSQKDVFLLTCDKSESYMLVRKDTR
ncbi:MAG: DUF421 domain-containing protein [Oscillospiraceae bacterium]|jgi:uncharacterized membrane protein YcaP (DUF421 family)|nr:DUF421 domain-containing protein [Oscillospiraceae bacterium]